MPQKRGPIGLLAKGISTGIGMGFEAHAHHKEKKAAKSRDDGTETPSVEVTEVSSSGPIDRNAASPSDPPPSYEDVVQDASSDQHDPSHLSASEEKRLLDESADSLDDDELWDLDEAQGEIPEVQRIRKERDEEPPAYDEDDAVRYFQEKHPEFFRDLSEASTSIVLHGQLPLPVILPQRRPGSMGRGFVRAYSPSLADCGIDMPTFMDFLESFDKATKASPIFDVINVAAFIGGFDPSGIAFAVTTAVNIAATAAKFVQGRTRTNRFLDRMNKQLFMPHGLYCMLMSYKPSKSQKLVEEVDVNTLVAGHSAPHEEQATSSSSNVLQSGQQWAKTNLRNPVSGTSHSELELPPSAPLIFPGIERMTGADIERQKSWSNKLSAPWMTDYFDRRAQANMYAKNYDSQLNVQPPPKFASRFSDPNHPVNQGRLITLVSGGWIGPGRQQLVEERRMKKQTKARALEQQRSRESESGGDSPGPSHSQRHDMEKKESLGEQSRELTSQTSTQSAASGASAAETEEVRYDFARAAADGAMSKHKDKPRRARKQQRRKDKKLMKQNVLYMMIVQMPSEEEMSKARQLIEQQKRQKSTSS